jgi:hypothetical protein
MPDSPEVSELSSPESTVGKIGVAETGTGHPLIQQDPQAAAFFDLDNTVIQGASMFHLAKGLYRG